MGKSAGEDDLMGVPIVYRKKGETTLANYDYVDIATGTGYIKLYAGGTYANGISGGNLSNITYYANPSVSTTNTTGGAAWAKVIDRDFDTLLNKPMTFKGKAIINLTFGMSQSTSGTGSSFIQAKFRKWNGTTETDLVTISGQAINIGATAAELNTFAMNMEIPQTNFKRGETLRMTIEVWSMRDSGTTSTSVYYDPMNRDTTGTAGTPTTLIVQMPVRITL